MSNSPHELEIRAPLLFVVAAFPHLVDARAAVVDGRDAVLDPGGEHEGQQAWQRFPVGARPRREEMEAYSASAST